MKKKKLTQTQLIEQELCDMVNDGVIQAFVLCIKYEGTGGLTYETSYSGDDGTALVCALHCKGLAKDNVENG